MLFDDVPRFVIFRKVAIFSIIFDSDFFVINHFIYIHTQ
jgi:hypothetical protein